MNRLQRSKLLLLGAVFSVAFIGAGAGCWLVFCLQVGAPQLVDAHGGGHHWLHEQLDLSAEEHVRLEPIEIEFAQREKDLADALQEAKRQLAEAVEEDKAYTPRVSKAIEEIHGAMAALQKATIEHLFEMEEALSAEHYERLLRLAGDSLRK